MSTAKIAAAASALLLFPVIVIAGAGGALSAILGSDSTSPSQAALADIPADYLPLYREAAAACPGLDWAVLAAIGKIESDHGRSALPGVPPGTENPFHAAGVMQIVPKTWAGVLAHHQIPPGGVSPPSRWNAHDSIFAAAFLLCDNNISRDPHAAIFAYNHSENYVNQVLAQAAQYRQAAPVRSAGCPAPEQAGQSKLGQAAGNQALVAVAFACAQLGKPYVWGGNGNPGFDCSGLTHAAYAAADITIPRTAQTQYNAGPLLPSGTPLQSGDLVFFGTPSRIHHVGISLGGMLMVNAPTFSQPVQVADIRGFGDFAGASRPTVRTSDGGA
jgi:cell wall-associated NlpC family hydrolase